MIGIGRRPELLVLFLAFSPEREDPGNPDYGTTDIPKIVSGYGEVARELVALFYSSFIKKVVTVSLVAKYDASRPTT